MPIFDTPAPISATIELSVGEVQIVASDRTDTVVEVRPTDPADDSDVEAAQKTRVEYTDGALLVRAPKSRALDFSKKTRSVTVVVELPTGSQVHGDGAVADFTTTGTLGESRFKTSVGHIRLDRIGPARVDTGGGHITIGAIAGNTEIATGTGKIRVGSIDGTATIKNSNGIIHLGAVTGDARLRSANGDITVDQAGAGVDAKTANGSVRVDEVVRGSIVMRTAAGDLEVGIATGTAAWLELHTGHGRVTNSLDSSASGPAPTEETVEVRANTSYGDITIRRS